VPSSFSIDWVRAVVPVRVPEPVVHSSVTEEDVDADMLTTLMDIWNGQSRI